MVCTFFGHRQCPGLDSARLYKAVEDLVEQGVDIFLVGYQGEFDWTASGVLRDMEKKYPHISFSVVLAQPPGRKERALNNTLLPEGIENGPPRFAIDRRNRWMVKQADIVLCYIRVSWGGAYKFVTLARKKGKQVINLCTEGVQ